MDAKQRLVSSPRKVDESGPALPTVREILDFAEFQRGVPEVLAGRQHLDNRVRWVHILETSEVHSLLRGQELVLSTGAAWPTQPEALRSLAAALAEAKVSGLVLELSERLPHAPRVLIEACHQFKIPLVVLHAQIQFVVVTEHVHSMITAQQLAMLRGREEVNRRFTEMISRGVSSAVILQQCSELLDLPVVLLDSAHRLISVQNARNDIAALVSDLRASPEAWAKISIAAHGQRWGTLAARRSALSKVVEPATRFNSRQITLAGVDYLLSQAALALAIGRLAAGDTNPWRTDRDAGLLASLRAGNFAAATEFSQLAEALGFPVQNRKNIGVALEIPLQLSTSGVYPAASTLADALEAEGLSVLVAAESRSRTMLRFTVALPDDADTETLAQVVRALWPTTKIAVGRPAHNADELSISLEEARSLLNLPSEGLSATESAPIRYAETHQLRLLIGGLRHQSNLQSFVGLTLGPILDWDTKHSGDLLQVLRAYLKHPANRTEAAAESHLSRSVFYQRLALIEEVLAVDLSSGEVISSLYSAVLAYDAR